MTEWFARMALLACGTAYGVGIVVCFQWLGFWQAAAAFTIGLLFAVGVTLEPTREPQEPSAERGPGFHWSQHRPAFTEMPQVDDE